MIPESVIHLMTHSLNEYWFHTRHSQTLRSKIVFSRYLHFNWDTGNNKKSLCNIVSGHSKNIWRDIGLRATGEHSRGSDQEADPRKGPMSGTIGRNKEGGDGACSWEKGQERERQVQRPWGRNEPGAPGEEVKWLMGVDGEGGDVQWEGLVPHNRSKNSGRVSQGQQKDRRVLNRWESD